MQQTKIIFWFFILLFIYSIRPCLAKPYFISLENCQNKLKCVFAKHPLRKKKILYKKLSKQTKS
jgi:hypothetical protein